MEKYSTFIRVLGKNYEDVNRKMKFTRNEDGSVEFKIKKDPLQKIFFPEMYYFNSNKIYDKKIFIENYNVNYGKNIDGLKKLKDIKSKVKKASSKEERINLLIELDKIRKEYEKENLFMYMYYHL